MALHKWMNGQMDPVKKYQFVLNWQTLCVDCLRESVQPDPTDCQSVCLTVCLSVCLSVWLSVCPQGHMRIKTTTTKLLLQMPLLLLCVCRPAGSSEDSLSSWRLWNTLFAVGPQDFRLQVDVCLSSGHLRTPPGLLSYLWRYQAVRLWSQESHREHVSLDNFKLYLKN